MKRHGWRLTWCGAWTWAALAASLAAAQPRPAAAPTTRPNADPATAVQLAWMADPAVFPYPLTARIGGAGLVVSGLVPNERVQWQAVRVAQRATNQNVIDDLKLNPRLPLPAPASDNAGELEHQAAGTVTTALGARANNIMVFGDRSGRVTLTGTVATIDDLLTASACLRRLPGCGCVDNRLAAVPGTGVTTAAATLPPIILPTSAMMQSAEPPLVTASVPPSADGPVLPDPTKPVAPAAPPVLRKEAAASARALPRPEAPKRLPPPVTLLASATRAAGESDLVMPAVVLRPSPVLAAPVGDIVLASAATPPAATPPATASEKPSPHPSTPPEPPSPPRIINAEQLRASLDAACHGLAGDLQVQLTDERHVAVSLRLRSMLDWDWVRARIRSVAESAGLTVTFNVTVKPW